jgi:hypothetical protein
MLYCVSRKCAVGWVDVGTSTRVWWIFVGFNEKVGKIAEKRVLLNRSLEEKSCNT